MKRRLLAALAALLLLIVGTGLVLAYVEGADARALAGVRTTEVLIADQLIPAGTPADQLGTLVRTEVLPQKAAVDGRVTAVEEIAGLVTTVDLQPGEQLLLSRFGEAQGADAAGTVAVPEGLQEVSVLLEPQRAVGGRLAAGDTVGVVVSIGDGLESGRTHAVLHQVLVTQVQGAPTPVDPDAEASTEAASDDGTGTTPSGSSVPTQSLMITLAVSAAQAEAVVYGIEHGTLWLSLEPADAETGGTDVVDAGNIYEKDFA
jgi:pilus assembly protein CpaB